MFTISTKNTTLKSRELILSYLEKNKSASTGELITFVSKEAKDCVDKVPQVLLTLSKEKKIVKVISKEKKGFIWSLT